MKSLGNGETMFYIGIAGALLSFVLLVVLRVALSAKEKKIKKELNSEYFDVVK